MKRTRAGHPRKRKEYNENCLYRFPHPSSIPFACRRRARPAHAKPLSLLSSIVHLRCGFPEDDILAFQTAWKEDAIVSPWNGHPQEKTFLVLAYEYKGRIKVTGSAIVGGSKSFESDRVLYPTFSGLAVVEFVSI